MNAREGHLILSEPLNYPGWVSLRIINGYWQERIFRSFCKLKFSLASRKANV